MEMTSTKATFKKYPAYKDSGSDWSGQIPIEWNALPIRAIFEERNEKNDGPKTDFILSVTKDRGVIPYDEKGQIGNNKSEDIERYKLVYPNDFVINKMNVIIGSLGMSKYFGAFSQVYLVYKPKSSRINIEYYSFIFSNPSFYKSLIRFCTGIMELRESLNKNDFKKIILPYPDFDTQTAIVEFLNDKTAKIDLAIAQKEKMIALLKERKQIIIQDLVTGKWSMVNGQWSMTPRDKMRDSGVEWIGEIPEGWSIQPVKSVFKLSNIPGKDGLPILSVSIHNAVSDKELDDDENLRGKVRIESKEDYKFVQPGDIVYNMMRAWQGGIGAVRTMGLVSPAYIVVSPKKKIRSQFFEYFMRTRLFINEMDKDSRGITDFRKRLYWNEFKNLQVLVPSLDEQKIIIDVIEAQSAKIDKAIALQEQQIEKLKELKATLIDSAVTGKIKVNF